MRNRILFFVALLTSTNQLALTQNTVYGAGAGGYNTSTHNSLFGADAGNSKYDRTYNYTSMFGESAGKHSQGDKNCFFGHRAGDWYNGEGCTAFGYYTGGSGGGIKNTLYGLMAGYNCIGDYNVFLGRLAGSGRNRSNTLIISNGNNPSPIIYGNFLNNQLCINTSTAGYTLHVNGAASASSFYTSSDDRFNENMKSVDSALAIIKNINVYTYSLKQTVALPEKAEYEKEFARLSEIDTSNISREVAKEIATVSNSDALRILPRGSQYGFSAQEVKEVLPQLVAEDDAHYLSINYDGFVPILIQAVKEISSEKDRLKNDLDELAIENVNLRADITKLSAQYDQLLSDVDDIKTQFAQFSHGGLKENLTFNNKRKHGERDAKKLPKSF